MLALEAPPHPHRGNEAAVIFVRIELWPKGDPRGAWDLLCFVLADARRRLGGEIGRGSP